MDETMNTYIGSRFKNVDPFIRESILELESQFVERPGSFHNENKVEDELKDVLRGELKDILRDKGQSDTIETKGHPIKGTFNQNREDYISELCRGDSNWNRVQSQLNIGASSSFDIDEHEDSFFKKVCELARRQGRDDSDRGNLTLDIGVLQTALHPLSDTIDGDFLEFCIAGGAQFWPPSGLSHAIEVKYFKTMTSPGSDLKGDNPEWDRIQDDIDELKLLSQHGVNCHLVIVSNMNIFRRWEDTTEHFDQYQQHECYMNRLNSLEEWCGEHIHLWYIHPIPECLEDP